MRTPEGAAPPFAMETFRPRRQKLGKFRRIYFIVVARISLNKLVINEIFIADKI
jgi:hypothetical protein